MSTYLVGQNLPTEPAGERFAKLVRRGGILRIPGAYNGLAALLARRHGFEALYVSGALALSSSGLRSEARGAVEAAPGAAFFAAGAVPGAAFLAAARFFGAGFLPACFVDLRARLIAMSLISLIHPPCATRARTR